MDVKPSVQIHRETVRNGICSEHIAGSSSIWNNNRGGSRVEGGRSDSRVQRGRGGSKGPLNST